MIDFVTQHVTRSYPPGRRALNDVSLEIVAGSFTVVTGPSGSGKSTLLSLLGALEQPDTGRVRAAGLDVTSCSGSERTRFRRRLGIVFQDFALIPGMVLWENVTAQMMARGESAFARRERALRWLDAVGLRERLLSRPEELSGGEKQRVAIARALAGEPEALLADEPTSNLDDESATTVTRLLLDLHATGRTVIVASHDPRFKACASAVVALDGGRVMNDGENFMRNSAT